MQYTYYKKGPELLFVNKVPITGFNFKFLFPLFGKIAHGFGIGNFIGIFKKFGKLIHKPFFPHEKSTY